MNLLRRVATIFAFVVTTVVLVMSVSLLLIQAKWDQPEKLDPQDAFVRGSIGTEIMPLPFFVALPKLYPNYFEPRAEEHSYVRQFGMNRNIENDYELPTGFFLSNKRPKSGAPSPVKFVGISCVMCHSTEIHKANGETEFVIGAGNMDLNLFAWIDSFQNAVLDPNLTVERVTEVFESETGESVSWSQRLMMQLWLRGIRSRVRENAAKYGDPFAGEDVFNADFVPTGPGRTQPFRTLVRRLLDRPGNDMAVYTKVASVFHEDRREWAQVDGSIRDLHARSSVAAFAAGATPQNMALPDVAHNIRYATEFTRDLSAPSFYEVFPELEATRDEELELKGRAVYREHCHSCHGSPSDDGWETGPLTGNVVHYEEIGTDKERVAFRRFAELPDLVHASFPRTHPFHFDRDDIRPGRLGTTPGFVNAPIEYAYARAPYLHNASVLTLAELINLRERQSTFYRGRNIYDAENVGLDGSTEQTPGQLYFHFDTSKRGNSNQGHNYPWAFDDPDRNVDDLQALLAYLKTI